MAPSTSQLLVALRTAGLVTEAPPVLPDVSALAVDSRNVANGNLFIAVRGSSSDGHQHAAEAVSRGAALLVVERPLQLGVPEIVVSESTRAAHVLAGAWFDDPAASLSLTGVTGTNGKTTTTAILRHLLNGDHTAGSIGTLGAYDGTGRAVPSTAGALTTPGPLDLQATLAALRAGGVHRVVMETSSHALDQGRLDALTFDSAVFTNLTRDHLDYHLTMEHYRAAKLRLAALLAPAGSLVLNADDPAWGAVSPSRRRVTFGRSEVADVRAREIVLTPAASHFVLDGLYGTSAVTLPLLGDFNISNALAAAAAALAANVSFASVCSGLGTVPQVPGRMERLAASPCVVLRDYAHTPDALERALVTLGDVTAGRVLVLFGCGGDRDKGKRPLMGQIAEGGADVVMVTSDNPRTEDPEAIIDDIMAGMRASHVRRHPDRREAIRMILEEARPDDTVLLAGKGHETYQVVGHEKVPFDERQIVRELGLT